MSATTDHFPTVEDAIAYRRAWDKRMKELYRKTLPTLRGIVAQKHNYVLGGPRTIEEHVKVILDDEYPMANLNEAIHVCYHDGWQSDACDWCASVPGLAEHTAAASDSDTQPDPYIDPIAAEHVSEYEHGAMAKQCRCGHPRWVHYRDGSEQGGGCDATQIGDAPSRCHCKGLDELAIAL